MCLSTFGGAGKILKTSGILNFISTFPQKNITFNYLKKLHRENLTDLDSVQIDLEDPFADPGAALITREMNLKLKNAINDLPPRCKLIFTLVKEDGLSYKQTAQLLNISESTVDNQLSIALKKISGAIMYRFRHN